MDQIQDLSVFLDISDHVRLYSPALLYPADGELWQMNGIEYEHK